MGFALLNWGLAGVGMEVERFRSLGQRSPRVWAAPRNQEAWEREHAGLAAGPRLAWK